MDPEIKAKDARAVEDPIAAIFDLAEAVDRQTPTIRRVLRYVRVFVSLWLLLDFVMILVFADVRAFVTLLLFVPLVISLFAMRSASTPGMRLAFLVTACVFGVLQIVTFGPAFLVGVVLVSLFILGFVILELLRDLRSFFDYFALRHRVIQRVRQADPVVYVPEGKDSVQRILAHLSRTSADVKAAMARPDGLAAPALLTGRSGLTYSFDAFVRTPPSGLWRTLGLGSPVFAVYVKAFDAAPGLADLQGLARAVADVSEALRIPPVRAIALWKPAGDESVAADAYEYLLKGAVRVRIRGATFVCSLELAREGADGTYDFIPLVVDTALGGPVSPAVAKA